MTTLYLASGSPRRQELLTQLGLSFERLVPGIEERRLPQESAGHYVARLAREKRRRGRTGPARSAGAGADTIVILNGEVLENRAMPPTPPRCCACSPVRRIRS